MEGVALQADRARKNISESILSPKHQRGPGQFGGRGGKKERGAGEGQENIVKKEKGYSSSCPIPLSPFLVMRTGLRGREFEIEL